MTEEVSDHDEDVAAREIDEIKGMRLVQKTKNSYGSKNKLFVAYLSPKYPTMVLDNRINLDTLTLEAFQSFIVKKQGEGLSFSACSVSQYFLAPSSPWSFAVQSFFIISLF